MIRVLVSLLCVVLLVDSQLQVKVKVSGRVRVRVRVRLSGNRVKLTILCIRFTVVRCRSIGLSRS